MKHLLLRLFSCKSKTVDKPVTILTGQELATRPETNATAGVDLSRDANAEPQQPACPPNSPDTALAGLLLGAICLAYLQKLQSSSCSQTRHSKQRYKRKTPKKKNRTSYTAG